MLEHLLKSAPVDLVTLEWTVARLSERPFGIVILLIFALGAAVASLAITTAAAWGTIQASLVL